MKGSEKREPLRVLIILRGFGAGGSERQLIEFLRYADPRRLRITVACFYREAWHGEVAAIPTIEVIDLQKSGRYDLLRFAANLLCVAKRVKPRIVYGYGGTALFFAALVGWLSRAK